MQLPAAETISIRFPGRPARCVHSQEDVEWWASRWPIGLRQLLGSRIGVLAIRVARGRPAMPGHWTAPLQKQKLSGERNAMI